MDTSMISLLIAIIALLISAFTFVLWMRERNVKPAAASSIDPSTRPLQLQAYERLVLLAERISIPNIISRANQHFTGDSYREMQVLLIESIKQEFEYNTSQQIYVSPAAWDAVRNLKEQNMMVINQVSNAMPEGSKGIDLCKVLLDFNMNQQKGQLHTIVLEALNYEARKLMK